MCLLLANLAAYNLSHMHKSPLRGPSLRPACSASRHITYGPLWCVFILQKLNQGPKYRNATSGLIKKARSVHGLFAHDAKGISLGVFRSYFVLALIFSQRQKITKIFSSYSRVQRAQFKKSFTETLSRTIGINLWLAPQISEHCPNLTPGRCTINFSWFNRPGTASVLTPKAGTVQACRTSAEEIRARTCVLSGTTVRLSTSSSWNILSSSSLPGTM